MKKTQPCNLIHLGGELKQRSKQRQSNQTNGLSFPSYTVKAT